MSLLRRRMMMSGKEPDVPTDELDYLTIIPLHEEEIKYNIYPFGGSNYINNYIQAMPFYYRINKGEWIEVNLQPAEVLVFTITLTQTQELQLKCMGCDFNSDYMFETQRFTIYSKGMHNISGTPMSLLYGDGFKENNYVSDSLLGNLFAGNNGLIQILNPKTFLPYTELGNNCYSYMFYRCNNLINAPELPATTLAKRCYYGMFSGCTSLINAPELPATTLAEWCYSNMFGNCTKLNYIKMLATDISANDCLSDWVNNVSSTGTFVKSKDAAWNKIGQSGIPVGWTVIDDTFPTNEDGMPESTTFEFPMYFNTKIVEQSEDFLYRNREADDLTRQVCSFFKDLVGHQNTIDEYILNRYPIFIDGYKVLSAHTVFGAMDQIVTERNYGNYAEIVIYMDEVELCVEGYN